MSALTLAAATLGPGSTLTINAQPSDETAQHSGSSNREASSDAEAESSNSRLDQLAERARSMAQQPFSESPHNLPQELADLSYSELREIEFDPEQTLFRGEADMPFQAELYHRGGLRPNFVKVFLIDPETGEAEPLTFDPNLFNYRNAPVQPGDQVLEKELGFAGLKLLANLNADTPGFDELASFLGASYFRALGSGQTYGTSVRGVAINTGLENVQEQFPSFVELYLQKPTPDDRRTVIHTLLNGQSVTGAYRFTITPGDTTTIGVQTRMFFRDQPELLGVAPLTSMYFYGENDPNPKDFRPEVHDADGLLIRDGETGDTWRPLTSPEHVTRSDFPANDLIGFGLMQRDRDYAHYRDFEAVYHHRPSVWVQFDDPPGEGRVRLIEIPTDDEYMDNTVALWAPHEPPKAGEELSLSYRLLFTEEPAPAVDSSGSGRPAHIVATRYDRTQEDQIRVVLEFVGDDLPEPTGDADAPKLHAEVNYAGSSQAESIVLAPDPFAESWRLSFMMPRRPDSPAKLEAWLTHDDQRISETWSTTWNPPSSP